MCGDELTPHEVLFYGNTCECCKMYLLGKILL